MSQLKIDVVLSPPEIDLLPQRELSGTVAIAFDILRATSTMVTALANGAAGIRPVRTIEEAWALREKHPGALLGGERHGDRIEGFDLGNSPLEYRENVTDLEIISTTTNGTIALRSIDHAACVLAGSFLNLQATARAALGYCKINRAGEILLVCAGTFREAALEDILAAGMLISLLPNSELTDSAQMAVTLFDQSKSDLRAAMASARNGRALHDKGREAEIDWCSQVSIYDLVAQMSPEGMLRKLDLK